MKKSTLVVLLTMVLAAMPAFANTYVCQGTVTNLAVYSAGYVTLSLTGTPGMSSVTVCSTNANFNGWTPDGCKAVYSTLLSAKSRGLQVAIEFNDSLSCTTQPVGAGLANSNYAVYIPN